MSLSIPGYKVSEKINESSKSVVYRANRASDKQPVIIKTLNTAYPTHKDIDRVTHGYKTLRNLNIAGVPREFGLEEHNDDSLETKIIDFGLPTLLQHEEEREKCKRY